MEINFSPLHLKITDANYDFMNIIPTFAFQKSEKEHNLKRYKVMKKGIHPQYREVVFLDTSNEHKFITKSTIETSDTITFEGQEYPLVKIEVSSESHPFFTGKKMFVDTAGRVEKFNRRFGKKKK